MNKLIILAALFSVCTCQTAVSTTQWFCDILNDEYCEDHMYEPRCASNGVTYRNFCDLGKAHCKDDNIDQRHPGPCNYTIPSAQEIVQGSAQILDVQCGILSHVTCGPKTDEKVCGTDSVTYVSFCEYEKARCTHKELHVKKLGDCAA